MTLSIWACWTFGTAWTMFDGTFGPHDNPKGWADVAVKPGKKYPFSVAFPDLPANQQDTIEVILPPCYDLYVDDTLMPRNQFYSYGTGWTFLAERDGSTFGPLTQYDPLCYSGGYSPYVTHQIEIRPKNPGSGAPAGTGSCSLGSVSASFSLGNQHGGSMAGTLNISADALNAPVYTPAGLTATVYSGVSVLSDSSGGPRQVLSSETLADIQTLSPSSYTINFYPFAQVGGMAAGTGWYSFTGNPTVTWKVEDPDAGSASAHTRLRISEIRGTVTKTNEYTYAPATESWSLSTGGDATAANFARIETKSVSNDLPLLDAGGAPVLNPDSTPVTQSIVVQTVQAGNSTVPTTYTTHFYNHYSWGTGEVTTVVGNGSDALTTTRVFDPSSGALTEVDYPDGRQEYYYDSNGSTTLGPFKDDSPAITGWLHDNNGDVINGQSVSQSSHNDTTPYDLFDSTPPLDPATQQTYNEQTTTTYSSATDYQTEVTRTYTLDAAAPWAGKALSTDYAGGRRDSWTYETGNFGATGPFIPANGGTALRTTCIHGTTTAPGGVAGHSTQDRSTYDEQGRLALEETLVLPTGATAYVVTSAVTHTYDAIGHLIGSSLNGRTTYSAVYGTGSQNNLKLSETDEQGIVTTYSDFDSLGHALTVTKVGITSSYGNQSNLPTNLVLDAVGNTLSQTVGTSPMQQVQTSSYNTAGQLVSQTSNGLTTSYAYTNGGRTVTETFPNGATQITDHYYDGRTKSITGTGVVGKAYDYGVVMADDATTGDKAGYQWNIEYVGTGTVPASTQNARYTKTVTDWMGRTTRVEKPTFESGTANTRYFYNGGGQRVRMTQPGMGTTLYTYDAMGNQTASGLDMDSDGQLSASTTDRVTFSDSSYQTVGSNTCRVTTTTVAGDVPAVTTQTEQLTGLPSNAVSLVTTAYPTNATGANPNVSVATTTVDMTNKLVTTTTSVPGASNPSVQVTCNGLLVSVKTPVMSGSNALTYGYDPLGRQSTVTDPSTGAKTTTTYDSTFGQIASVVIQSDDQSLGTSTVNTYYPATTAGGASVVGAGQLASTTVNGSTVSYTYNALNRVMGISGDTYPLGYTYDAYGALQTLTTTKAIGATAITPGNPNNSLTTWVYDAATGLLQQKLDNSQHGPSYTYWPSGKVKTRTWARGPVTTYHYDKSGLLDSQSYSDGTTPNVAITNNRQGKPAIVTDAAGIHTLTYTADGQLTGDTTTIPGDGVFSGMSTGVSVGYDGFLRRTSLTVNGPSGAISTAGYGYEAATGNLSTINDGVGGNVINYTYQPNSTRLGATTFKNNGALRLTTTRTPDGLGRLSSISNVAGGTVVSSHAYVYNAQGQRSKAIVADGSVWNYGYNARGELTSGHHNWTDGGTPMAGQQFDYNYDAIGNRVSTTVNGRSATYTPNLLNQYVSRDVPGDVDVLGTADPSATVTVNNQPPTTRTGSYFYKDLAVPNANASINQSVDVLAVKAGAGAGGADVISETQGNVFVPQTPEQFVYDLDGNLKQDGRWNYTWNTENQLVQMAFRGPYTTYGARILYFSYDWQGRRVGKAVASGTEMFGGQIAEPVYSPRSIVYDGWNPVAELATYTLLLRSYLWGQDLSSSFHGVGGVGGLLESNDLTGSIGVQMHCYGYDGNGNVTTLVQANNGSVSANYAYGPFGEETQTTGASIAQSNPICWSSKYNDLESGLNFYGYRYYDGGTGRWISADPIGQRGGANLYGFIGNNSLNRIDPDGHDIVSVDIHSGGNSEVESMYPATWANVLEDDYKSYAIGPQLGFLGGYHQWPGMFGSNVTIGHAREAGGAFKFEIIAKFNPTSDKYSWPSWQATVFNANAVIKDKITGLYTTETSNISGADGPSQQLNDLKAKWSAMVDAPRYHLDACAKKTVYFSGSWSLMVFDSDSVWRCSYHIKFSFDTDKADRGTGQMDVLESPHRTTQ